MSADQITQERVAAWMKSLEFWNDSQEMAIPVPTWRDILDALTTFRAEVQRLTSEQSIRACECSPDEACKHVRRAEAAEREVQRLTEEARRSDAGRVEVPEYGECAMLDQNGEDLNPLQEFVYCQEPAPNPPGIICGVDPKAQFREQLQAVLDWGASRLSPSPQPSADVVVVSGLALAGIGRKHFGNPIPQAWYAAARELVDDLRSSTNHDAQDAGEGR